MKIIGVSNFDLENVSDILIAENVNSYYGKLIIKFLEERTTDNSTYYPRLVDDDYILYEFKS